MKNTEIFLRDPFILPFRGRYYLYGSRVGNQTGFDVYESEDLENWSEPIEVFKAPKNFWADRDFWAPEVHYYNGKFYMFATFKAEGRCRGTQILIADTPLGPFEVHSKNPVTPMEWECLDGTLYIEGDGTPYMVFCHEWLQIKDGTICAIELSKDLKSAIGEPKLLFKATDASWIKPVLDNDKFVTDGPFLIKNNNGLFMIWSSFGTEGYCVAVSKSDNGTLSGNWKHFDELLFKKDGGHSMVFKTFENNPMLSLHWPNSKDEHPHFFEIDIKTIPCLKNV